MVHTITVIAQPGDVIDVGSELQSRGFNIVESTPGPGTKHTFKVRVESDDYKRKALVDVFRCHLPKCEVE